MGRVDEDALRRLILRQLEAGVPALAVCGTTGESSTLQDGEWERVLACSLETAGGKAVIIAGTGTNDLRHTLRRAHQAAALGADAQLVVTPYYNKTTQQGLVEYYSRLAGYTDLPILMYNVPGRTGLNMLPETSAQLAEHPHIIGIKEAGGNLNQLAALMGICQMPVYCGSDELNAPALQLGAQGVISVASNLIPAEMIRLCSAPAAAANAMQRQWMPLIKALFAETNPAPVKAALHLMGLCSDEVRLPLVKVQPETLCRLRSLLPEGVYA